MTGFSTGGPLLVIPDLRDTTVIKTVFFPDVGDPDEGVGVTLVPPENVKRLNNKNLEN